MVTNPENEMIHREFDTEAEEPGVQIAETVADIEETDTTELATIHECIDGVLINIFSTPPSPDAQMEVTFSYEGYRVTIEQDGTATFVKTE